MWKAASCHDRPGYVRAWDVALNGKRASEETAEGSPYLRVAAAAEADQGSKRER